MLNIVIPMAGLGSRFEKAGYANPKPFIPVGRRPMITWVVDNLTPSEPLDHRFVFVARKGHLNDHRRRILHRLPMDQIVAIDEATDGAAATVLRASLHVRPEEPMLIANSDQYLDLDLTAFYYTCLAGTADAVMMTFRSDGDPKWSYVLEEAGRIREVREKAPISDMATVGVYFVRRAGDFMRAAGTMIARDDRVNGEFYVAPAFNEMIEDGATVKGFDVPGSVMHGLGTPEDLTRFLKTDAFEDQNTAYGGLDGILSRIDSAAAAAALAE